MCIFSQAIQNVSDTLIFARHTDRDTQYVVYEMKYMSETENAMILPLPVQTPATESTIQFIDLSQYDSFFKDLSRAFPEIQPRGFARLAADGQVASNSILPVHEVGSFIASFVPTVGQFDRLDPRFSLPKSTWDKIPDYSDYGFAVFKLKQLAGKPHPIAFEFKSRTNDIFFPTMHIHDGEVHDREEFDHTLYLQHPSFDAQVGRYHGPNMPDRQTGLVRSKAKAGEAVNCEKTKGIVEPELLLHRVSYNGVYPNRDMVISDDQIKPQSRLRKALRYWPIAIPLAAGAWLINRRNQMSAKRPSADKPMDLESD